jgi:hypothetical protein
MTAVSLTDHDAVSTSGDRCCEYVSEHYPELGRLAGRASQVSYPPLEGGRAPKVRGVG